MGFDAHQCGIAPEAEFDEIGDGSDPETVLAGEGDQVRQPCHGAVIPQDFTDHAGGFEAAQARQVHPCFGVARACEHPAGLRLDGKDMSRRDQVLRTCVPFDRRTHRNRPVLDRNSGGNPFRRLNGHREVGRKPGIVAADHQFQVQLPAAFLGERQADQAPGVGGHEVDVVGRDALRRHQEVTFVLPVRLIHQDHHLSLAVVGEHLFDVVDLERFHCSVFLDRLFGLQQALQVSCQKVHLDMHPVPCSKASQGRHRQGMGDQGQFEHRLFTVIRHPVGGQADPVHRHGPLDRHETSQITGYPDSHPGGFPTGNNSIQYAGSIHMPRNQVTAERF